MKDTDRMQGWYKQDSCAAVLLQVVLFQLRLITFITLTMKFCLRRAHDHWPSATLLHKPANTPTHNGARTQVLIYTELPRPCWAAEVNTAESHVRELTWRTAQIWHAAVRLSPSLSVSVCLRRLAYSAPNVSPISSVHIKTTQVRESMLLCTSTAPVHMTVFMSDCAFRTMWVCDKW